MTRESNKKTGIINFTFHFSLSPIYCCTESGEDISPYATFQLSEAPTLAHPGPTNTLLHSFMYHERAMTEGCASPPPQVLRQLHNQSPYYNIVRLMASLFFVRIKFSTIGICDDIFEISFIVVPSLKHIHTLHHVTQIMKNRIHTSEKCQNIFTLMKHCH